MAWGTVRVRHRKSREADKTLVFATLGLVFSSHLPYLSLRFLVPSVTRALREVWRG